MNSFLVELNLTQAMSKTLEQLQAEAKTAEESLSAESGKKVTQHLRQIITINLHLVADERLKGWRNLNPRVAQTWANLFARQEDIRQETPLRLISEFALKHAEAIIAEQLAKQIVKERAAIVKQLRRREREDKGKLPEDQFEKLVEMMLGDSKE